MGFRLEYSTVAKCKPEHVWQKFQKLEEWGWWLPVIGKTQWLDGKEWKKGNRFEFELMRPRHMTFKPVITEAEMPNKITWVGKALGFRGEHGFNFDAQADRTTVIKTWENFSGFATAFLGDKGQQKVVAMYQEWVESLKTEGEKIAREEYARA